MPFPGCLATYAASVSVSAASAARDRLWLGARLAFGGEAADGVPSPCARVFPGVTSPRGAGGELADGVAAADVKGASNETTRSMTHAMTSRWKRSTTSAMDAGKGERSMVCEHSDGTPSSAGSDAAATVGDTRDGLVVIDSSGGASLDVG